MCRYTHIQVCNISLEYVIQCLWLGLHISLWIPSSSSANALCLAVKLKTAFSAPVIQQVPYTSMPSGTWFNFRRTALRSWVSSLFQEKSFTRVPFLSVLPKIRLLALGLLQMHICYYIFRAFDCFPRQTSEMASVRHTPPAQYLCLKEPTSLMCHSRTVLALPSLCSWLHKIPGICCIANLGVPQCAVDVIMWQTLHLL